jgi:hypothetical protein
MRYIIIAVLLIGLESCSGFQNFVCQDRPLDKCISDEVFDMVIMDLASK